ncbi:F5/8 type C domain-containing protein [Rathayibacter sp. PhB93]|uniref:family 43 glycosylhydrolase n=1 Tax=unclassified Rathayibacter TaxID=2609250 RepID=UPI000F46D2E4|nr:MULTISPECIES: family 43 glycosylhydrolase [unclassified Rathayibacter]ROQ00955.1 F5/8 type C domain-containing protein [Rathayibacter sp. PhB93]TDQ07309.1 F5/8 type C domain-containing protein [Rathayibacter sp. PhB1]
MTTPRPAVLCNPLDLAYRFQEIHEGGPDRAGRTVHREAADPSIVRFQDRFFLFASQSGGFWHSSDLVSWEFRATTKLPEFDYAPDVREVDGSLVICASRAGDSPYFRSENPLEDDFVEISAGFPFWDPHVFQDRDGRTYFYWGCSNKEPIRGTEVDRVTFAPLGETLDLISAHTDQHGWEQSGEDYIIKPPTTERERLILQHVGTEPYIEGAWMTPHADRYYLQYSAPGTEWNTYADGYYVGETPLGPFAYSPHSPFSLKPGGFITGAGHGSTFQDAHGNWWHAATMRVSVNESFERRIGLFPAGFDADGVLFCNQNFGDYPTLVPNGPADPWTDTFAGWMLQSLGAAATASSSKTDRDPASAVDEDIRDWWVAGSAEPGEWLHLDLRSERTVHAIQVNLADDDLAAIAPLPDSGQQFDYQYRGHFAGDQPTEFRIELSVDGVDWTTVVDHGAGSAEAPHAFAVLDEPVRARFVRLTGGRMPFGGPLAVSGLRVFGLGDGDAPAPVIPAASRVDELTADLEWKPSHGAQGYNVRYGIAPDKLYNSWLLYGQTSLRLPTLNAGHDYWVAVDAFNENGITPGAATPLRVGPCRSAEES